VDHAAIARACGCEGIQVERPEDYLPAVKSALRSGRPCLIDVMTDPEAYPPITLFDRLESVRAAARA
jgi:acetolactate synthase-1/2/3 large subunit